MYSVRLEDLNRARLVGFVHFYPDLIESSGHCVFWGLMSLNNVTGSTEPAFLTERRAVDKSAWRVTQRYPLILVVSTPGLLFDMFIDFHTPHVGTWGQLIGPNRIALGFAILKRHHEDRESRVDSRQGGRHTPGPGSTKHPLWDRELDG